MRTSTAWSRRFWLRPGKEYERAAASSRGLLMHADRLLQRKILRRTSNHEAIVSRHKLPAVRFNVPDGEILGIHFDGHFFALTGIELHLAPADEPLWRFARRRRQRRIDLGNFGTRAASGVLDGEGNARRLSRRDFQI